MSRKLRWKALWNPEMYHGWGKTSSYFEGWYFKLVSPDGKQAFAVIPGISMDENGKSHAFIQVLDGTSCQAYYYNFSADEFIPSKEDFFLELGGNSFSAKKLILDLPDLKCDIKFEGNIPWPKHLNAPGIMGWFSFMPFMQCYHGVVSVNHTITGEIIHKGKRFDFSDGLGYIEKDWGTSFPASWIWMQTNHFESKTPVSLMASVAHIPWLGNHFIGYIVGFLFEGKVYRFATYTGAKMKADLNGDKVTLDFKGSGCELNISATQGKGAELISPITGDMKGKVNESLNASVHVRFSRKGKLLFEGNGKHAGLEVAGNVSELLTDKWRR